MSGRGRLIAGQAAIVAALIAIIYGTFLKPDDSSGPSGIYAGPQQNLDGNSDGKADKSGKGSGGNDGDQGGGGYTAGGGVSGAASATIASATTPPGTTPADYQYSDTLSALKDRLGLTSALTTDRLRRR